MSLYVDGAGWLAAEGAPPELRFAPTARCFKLDAHEPRGLVWHTTDTPTGVTGAQLVDRIREMPPANGRKASWHVLIDRLGVLHVSAPFTVGTWHCGVPGKIGGVQVRSINRNSIGVEIENGGRLKKIGDKLYCHPYAPDATCLVEGRGVPCYSPGGVFEGFTMAQAQSAEALIRAVAAHFPRWGRADFDHGHVDYEPDRREDPGPQWRNVVLPQLLDRVFGSDA